MKPTKNTTTLFKTLTAEETSEFRKWARDNYVPLSPIKGIWHPEVQKECVKINEENTEIMNSQFGYDKGAGYGK